MLLFAAVKPEFGPMYAFEAKSTEQASYMLKMWNKQSGHNATLQAIGTKERPEICVAWGDGEFAQWRS